MNTIILLILIAAVAVDPIIMFVLIAADILIVTLLILAALGSYREVDPDQFGDSA